MHRTIAAALGFLVCATGASAQGRAPADTSLLSLVNAEKGFSAASAAHGMKDAFLANAADDGVVFGPGGPANAKEQWEKGRNPPVLLTWRPAFAEVSAAGDLGFTTGPFEIQPDAAGAKPAYGHYMTIWRRQPDGEWKFAVDLGTSNSTPTRSYPDWQPPASARRAAPARMVDTAAARASLLAAERRLIAESASRGRAAALLAHAADDVRLHHEGVEPVMGKAEVRAALAERSGESGWTPTHSDVAASGDFGYVYGRYQAGSAGAGNYVRIWERKPGGEWKVALDLTSPPPPPRPAPAAAPPAR
ncbi:MAG: DUF4440 domain-containing protein [Gemmatimonadetes bacterium]|nr:DUF4440 domain-containing protein [Gemmatimonadota bacterium]